MSTQAKTWRVAYLGAGTIVKYAHIPNFQALANTESVAICDVDATRAGRLAEGAKIPGVYSDYRRLLDEVRPDITVVATPNVFHKEMALAALDAGSHVLCKKPLALTYADAAELFAAAAAKGLTLTVGTHFRFSAPMRLCKVQLEAGFFGRVYATRTVWHRRSGIPGMGGWFTNKDLAGGGSLLDIGVHALDRALFLMGYPKPVAVSGVKFAEFGPQGRGAGGWGMETAPVTTGPKRFDVDDLAWAFVRFENGAVLQFQVAWAANYPDQFFTEVFGTDGGAYVGNNDKVELYRSLNGQDVNINVPLPNNPPNSYAQLVQHFVRHLDGDASAEIITPEQALTSVQIIDAIGRSALSGREVVLE